MLLVFGVSLLLLFEVFSKHGYSSWITKRKAWMGFMCLLVLTPYINAEPLFWLSRTFSKRDCTVGWDHLFDCFSSFINGFSFSCLPDCQKGIFYCKPSPSLLALQQRKGKEFNNCSQNYLCIKNLWVQKANILWDTHMQKKGFPLTFPENHTFWHMSTVRVFLCRFTFEFR